jgi:hypothetical protein
MWLQPWFYNDEEKINVSGKGMDYNYQYHSLQKSINPHCMNFAQRPQTQPEARRVYPQEKVKWLAQTLRTFSIRLTHLGQLFVFAKIPVQTKRKRANGVSRAKSPPTYNEYITQYEYHF